MGMEKETNAFKENDNQIYAKVLSFLGNCRLKAYCSDGKIRICLIRGKLKKKIWIYINDIILISLRDFEDTKADIIHKFDEDQISYLINKNILDMNKLCIDNTTITKDLDFCENANSSF